MKNLIFLPFLLILIISCNSKTPKNQVKEISFSEYKESTQLENYVGSYSVKIKKSNNVDFDNVTGKIILNNDGVKIETNLPNMNLLEGTHYYGDKEYQSMGSGNFYFKLNKGRGDILSLSIQPNLDYGTFIVFSGGGSVGTIFFIEKF